ncbi:5'-3' exonuclease, alpha-helical arch, N-terminal [Cynara cardunculus var. scolymus]|uniref:5'-3' exonuclease, alpha-helical arch, N-terminal n=1 Tax=Cynara cardunculus var. scolymus TaxID=59895 RepID=A0A118K4U3_CYNCS|nr:5'-3' exonuclease, alpha-helical arch, N-terminal [Cynara cardunculus var. scolymus]
MPNQQNNPPFDGPQGGFLTAGSASSLPLNYSNTNAYELKMGCCQFSNHLLNNFCRTLYCCRGSFSTNHWARTPHHLVSSSRIRFAKGYHKVSNSLRSELSGTAHAVSLKDLGTVEGEATQQESTSFDSSQKTENLVNIDSSNGRVMLIDGTSIIYRSYYKLLAKLHHGYLSNADGNGDWVLTISTALSLIIDVLEFTPSHVAVVFDHDVSVLRIPSFMLSARMGGRVLDGRGFAMVICLSRPDKNLWQKVCLFIPSVFSSQLHVMFALSWEYPRKQRGQWRSCQTFRHTLYPSYKSNRPPTPDTIVQGLQYLKASIKAMSIKVIEVPGVEADDVIGTLAMRSVEAGFKLPHICPMLCGDERGLLETCPVAAIKATKAELPQLNAFHCPVAVIKATKAELPELNAFHLIGYISQRRTILTRFKQRITPEKTTSSFLSSSPMVVKVRVVSPDKDFFQILSPSLRLLRIAPRGFEMVSFGMEDFAKKYGAIEPSQFVDVMALVGDRSDNIPGVDGIGDVHAVQLISRFGTLENLLQHVDQVEEERIRKALIANKEQALLSKELALLRSDLPHYMVPYSISDLAFKKPEDNGEKFTNLLTAIGAYAEGFSLDSVIRRAFYLWKKLEKS